MNVRDDEGLRPERRVSRRVGAEHAARLQFVARISGALGSPRGEPWPTLICRTRDLSEGGLGLDVPALREGDNGFFGVDGPVRVTLGLPTGAVEARGVTVRYVGAESGGPLEGFFVGVRITDVEGDGADRLRSYLGGAR